MTRIEKMYEIAEKHGVKASIRETSIGMIIAHVNGVTFKVRGLASFDARCRELVGYEPPKPVDLTARLAKIEELAIAQYS